MRKLLIIALSNLKKRKSNSIILLLLVMVSTVLMYSGIAVLARVDKFLDEKKEDLNGADVMVYTSRGYESYVEPVIESIDGYKSFEKEEECYISSTVVNNNCDETLESVTLIICRQSASRDISVVHKMKDDGEFNDDSIIVPYYFYTLGYRAGDELSLDDGDKKYKFVINGFSEDVMLCSPSNVSMFLMYVSDESYEEVESSTGCIYQDCYRIILKDGYSSVNYEGELFSKLNEISVEGFVVNTSFEYDSMKVGAGYMVNIIMAIIVLFAFLILIIVAIVMHFSINSHIESNLPNIGTLESIGYTSKQLRLSSIIEFMSIALVGYIVGIFASLGFSSIISKIVSSSIGLLWVNKYSILGTLLSLVSVVIIVILVTYLSSRKYSKITPLIAFRGGIDTYNFKKTKLPLATSKLGVNSTIGVKGALQNKKQSITMLIIIIILSFSCVAMIGIYYNFTYDTKAIEEIVGIEKPDAQIANMGVYSGESGEKFTTICEEVLTMDGIKNAYYEESRNMKISNNGEEIFVYTTARTNYDCCRTFKAYKGRLPQHDNEVVLTLPVTKQLGVDIGDVVTLNDKGVSKEFVVVGINQQISNLGKAAQITMGGLLQIDTFAVPSALSIYLEDGYDIDEFVDKINSTYPASAVACANFITLYNQTMFSITSAMSMVCILFVALMGCVIVLVLYMIIKMKIIRERQMIGVYKAIGYTTRDIIIQMLMNLIPVITIGTLIGVILGKFFTGSLVAGALSISGITKVNITMTFTLIASSFIGIIVFSGIVIVLCSLKARKIEAYKLITEQ